MKRLSAIFGVVLVIALTASPTWANTLVATKPTTGATLNTAPTSVTITTELELLDSGNQISVSDPSGVRVDDGTLTVSGTDAIIGLKSLTKSGIYKVEYELLADNDVPLFGSFTFNFSVATVETPTPQTEAPTVTTESGSNFTTNVFVIILLLSAIAVTYGMALYARKLYRER